MAPYVVRAYILEIYSALRCLHHKWYRPRNGFAPVKDQTSDGPKKYDGFVSEIHFLYDVMATGWCKRFAPVVHSFLNFFFSFVHNLKPISI
jgi:hypothetical protein